MEQVCCVILAAGMGKRMGGDLPKAIVKTREKALVDHVLVGLAGLSPVKTIVVTGHRRDLLEGHLRESPSAQGHTLVYAHQDEQLGTGHAVRCALPYLEGFKGTVIITYADHPLFRPATLKFFLDFHAFSKATLTLISFTAPPPNSYGRVVRDLTTGTVTKIVEAKDCDVGQLLGREVNSGVYAVDSSFLKPAIEALKNNNAQGEFYLTDIVEKAGQEGQTVAAFPLADAEEAGGVNTPRELAAINSILMRRQIELLLDSGVSCIDPRTLYIDPTVSVRPGATIGPNVQLRGNTSLASGVVIEGDSLIIDSQIDSNAVVKLGCRIDQAVVGEGSSIGPFAHIRPGTRLGAECRIGNFVETKNATLDNGAKASHLTYLGDCTIGTNSNIGAGTITCNYDGYKKSKTTVGKDVFVGSNSALVAPVTIGDGALVGAGSVITRDVPSGDLGLARAKQENAEGWAARRRQLLAKK